MSFLSIAEPYLYNMQLNVWNDLALCSLFSFVNSVGFCLAPFGPQLGNVEDARSKRNPCMLCFLSPPSTMHLRKSSMPNSGISSTRIEKNDGDSLTCRGSQAKKSTMLMLPTQKSACPFLTTVPAPSELSGLSYGKIRTSKSIRMGQLSLQRTKNSPSSFR